MQDAVSEPQHLFHGSCCYQHPQVQRSHYFWTSHLQQPWHRSYLYLRSPWIAAFIKSFLHRFSYQFRLYRFLPPLQLLRFWHCSTSKYYVYSLFATDRLIIFALISAFIVFFMGFVCRVLPQALPNLKGPWLFFYRSNKTLSVCSDVLHTVVIFSRRASVA